MFKRIIRRPVLAIVISLLILFLGVLSIKALPVTQFPKIAPPRVITPSLAITPFLVITPSLAITPAAD